MSGTGKWAPYHRRVLEAAVGAEEPVTAKEVAGFMGGYLGTVKDHLEVLVGEGKLRILAESEPPLYVPERKKPIDLRPRPQDMGLVVTRRRLY